MQINDKKNFALLCAAKATVFLNKFLNIFIKKYNRYTIKKTIK